MEPDDTSAEPRPNPDDSPAPGFDDIPVVGIGASAGGVAALQSFFANTPPDGGLAYVVVMHLSPKHESALAETLQRVSPLPVVQVTGPVRLAPNQVYVIPPSHNLSLADGELRLAEPDQVTGPRVVIDLFFRALADTHGRNAVAVVLSGAGSDGAIGLGRVKERGGITLVQDPAEAEFDGMPRAAIGTGLADLVLPVAAIPAQIQRLRQAARQLRLPTDGPGYNADHEALRELFVLLRVRTGHDFTSYKRPTMLRRIGRRLQVNGVSDLPVYLAILRERPAEVQALLRDLLISVTNFFRDKEAFEALALMLPAIFAGREPDEQIRAWVAGCATGEEAFSLAMLLCEYAAHLSQAPAVQIFATDIDEEAIAVAREGLYPENIIADVSPERLRRFFNLEQGGYRVKKELRDLVLFAPHNLLRDPPFSRLDLITCRNLLIYLDRDMQERVLELFHFVLRPGGRLLLGASESADTPPGLFSVADKKQRIYARRTVTRSTLTLPHLPLGVVERSPGRNLQLPARHTGDQKPISFAELHQQLLELYAPPSVLVNEAYEILHLSDSAGRFLRLGGGEPSYNLLKVVHPDLRLELRTALFRAGQNDRDSVASGVPVTLDNELRHVTITVRPAQGLEGASGFLLVLFAEASPDEQARSARPIDEEAEPLVRQLDAELLNLREQLRLTVEQYETSAEELKASNEELQALNEELRSATEELETSKEELQSMNEELITVNQELKNKVDELSRANSDLQNLLSATDIGTIFLDRELRVKRYTARIQELFNLIDSDIDRPLAHVTHRLKYDDLLADVASVIDRLATVEREAQHLDGRWFLVRLLPYRTMEDKIDGVVLTFVEITRRKLAEQRLIDSHNELEARISERTAEVEQINVVLRAEVVERRAAEAARQTVLRNLVSVQEEERRRISREIHDGLGQELTGLLLGIHALREASGGSGSSLAQLDRLQAAVEKIDREMRQLARGLRPTLLDDLGLAAALANFIEEWSRQSGVRVEFHDGSLAGVRLPPELETTFYRVILEALHNIQKHAAAARVSVLIERSDGSVMAVVEDNGRGFDVDAALAAGGVATLGLLGMRERMELVGGSITIESTPGAGTTIFARAPLPPETGEELE